MGPNFVPVLSLSAQLQLAVCENPEMQRPAPAGCTSRATMTRRSSDRFLRKVPGARMEMRLSVSQVQQCSYGQRQSVRSTQRPNRLAA